MTEGEAKTKWCPFVRSSVVGFTDAGKLSVISNRDAAQLVEVDDVKVMTHNCIGASCMAWRTFIYDHQRNLPDNQRSDGGFCGLAGKP